MRRRAKLKEFEVREIVRRLQNGERQKVLSYDYNISTSVISAIKCGKRWTHITGGHIHGKLVEQLGDELKRRLEPRPAVGD